MGIPLVSEKEVLTTEFRKYDIILKIEPRRIFQQKYFDITIKGSINIFFNSCISGQQISSGMTISLPRELMEEISNILGIEIEKDGEINKLILDQNIAILDFVPTIDEVDKLKIEDVSIIIGHKREKCEEILMTGYIFIWIDYTYHEKISATIYIPTELIKFIGNSLGMETVKIIMLDRNIHLKDQRL